MTKKPSFREIFERECPYYLAMGMSLDDYWHSSPYLAVFYRKAQRLRNEQKNEEAWLHGLYVYQALNVSLSNAFSKKGSKKEKYPNKPLDFNIQEEKTETEKLVAKAQEQKKANDFFAKLKESIDRQNNKRG